MKERLQGLVKKYQFVLFILLAGVVLMLLPTGESGSAPPETIPESFSLTSVEEKMEDILCHMDGVGQVKVMLTLKSGTALQLAVDEDHEARDSQTRQEKQVVKLSRGSGQQEVVVTEEVYPTYLGAVVVCEGAGSSEVKLRVIEAVTVLTSLPSDRITVVKWEENT